MKILALLFFSGLCLVSCKSYQYTQFSSDMKQTSESHHYYIENDSVYIDFDFSGSNFPISIYISNVSSQELYLNLAKTIFLKNDVILASAAIPERKNNAANMDSSGIENSDPNNVLIPTGKSIELFYRIYPIGYNKKIRSKSKRQLFDKQGKRFYLKYLTIPNAAAPRYEIAFTFANSADYTNAWTESAFFWTSDVFTSIESPSTFPIQNPNITHTSIRTAYGKVSGGFFLIALVAIPLLLPDYEE